MMGLKDAPYWLSWFIYYASIVTVISFSSLLILKINVFVHSNPLLLFLFFWIYGISLFGFILVIQALFNSALVASIAGTLIYFSTSFIDFAIKDKTIPESLKNWASLFSTVAVARGASNIARFESSKIGL